MSLKYQHPSGSSEDFGIGQVINTLDTAATQLVTALSALSASDLNMCCDSYCVRRDTSSSSTHVNESLLDSLQQLRMDYSNMEHNTTVCMHHNHNSGGESEPNDFIRSLFTDLVLNGDESPLSLCMLFCKLEAHCLNLFKQLNLSVYN